MSFLNFLVLSTALSLPIGVDASEKKAVEVTFKAIYIQNGYDKKVQEFEEKVMPEYIKENKWLLIAARTAMTNQISYQWSF